MHGKHVHACYALNNALCCTIDVVCIIIVTIVIVNDDHAMLINGILYCILLCFILFLS